MCMTDNGAIQTSIRTSSKVTNYIAMHRSVSDLFVSIGFIQSLLGRIFQVHYNQWSAWIQSLQQVE